MLPDHKRLFQSAALLAMLMLALSGCGLFTLDSPVSCDSDSFYGYKATLPSSARNVEEKCSNDFNPSYEASFTLPASDLSAFQASTPITEWTTSAPENAVVSRYARGASSVLYGTSSNGAIYEQVLIDTSDPQTYKVTMQLVNVD